MTETTVPRTLTRSARATGVAIAIAIAPIACGDGRDDDDVGEASGEAGDDDGGDGGTQGMDDGGSQDAGSGGSSGTAEPIDPEGDPGCGLDAAAFCETFETASPGGRGGDLDESRFAFSRWGHYAAMFERPSAWTRGPDAVFVNQRNDPTLCGAAFENVLIGGDARICPGNAIGGGTSNVFSEVFNDAGDFGINSLMVRQLFDFSDGGIVVFDVDAKRNSHWDGHGWWIEVWVTEDPAPIPYHGAPTVESYPRNGVGVQFVPRSFECPFEVGDCNQAGNLFVTHDYEIVHDLPGGGLLAVEDSVPNHFEIRIAQDRVDVYASDAGQAETHLVYSFVDLDIPFDAGYVHFQHSHYNAFKGDENDGVWASPSQTYRWDNIAFDGPVYAPLRVYDVPDLADVYPDQWVAGSDVRRYGYDLGSAEPITVQVEGVDDTDITRAVFNFTAMVAGGQEILYRWNGGPEQVYVVPTNLTDYLMLRSLFIELPVESVVAGVNTMEIRIPEPILGENWEGIANMDLSLEVAP